MGFLSIIFHKFINFYKNLKKMAHNWGVAEDPPKAGLERRGGGGIHAGAENFVFGA
jgi:hypothetical protein